MAEPTGVIRPQPRNPALGAIADALRAAQRYTSQYQVLPQVPLLGGTGIDEILSLPGAAGLMEDVAAYGPRALIKGGNAATGGLGTFRPDPRLVDVAEVASTGAPIARAIARPVGRMAAQQIERAMSEGRGPLAAAIAPVRPMNVIKPKGGNWSSVAGSPEEAVRELKITAVGMDPEERIPMLENLIREQEAAGAVTPEFLDRMRVERARLTGDAEVNRWIDQKLAKYIRNEMATPEDPVRALAERGVLHVDPELLNFRPEAYGQYLRPGQRLLASTPMARVWEGASDLPVETMLAGNLLNQAGQKYVAANPWLSKVPPETPVHNIVDPRYAAQDLGFSHLVDELRNALNPASGLPRELRLRPEQLSKVTMPQAVELVSKINAWRAAQKAEADLARSTNAATIEHRAYPTVPGTDQPNERGLRWVELRTPKESGPEAESALESALKYEGEVMGHCVGGYCPDVMEGRSRIFSLRDAKGQPHVTIEVNPGQGSSQSEAARQARAEGLRGQAFAERVFDLMEGKDLPENIIQIKGKANRAPKEEYLPFVQDFVKSQRWGRVGDLGNTGLVKLGDQYVPKEELGRLIEQTRRFIDEAPGLREHREAWRAYNDYRGSVPSDEYSTLYRAISRQVHPDVPYTYGELMSILNNPEHGEIGGVLENAGRLRGLLGEQGYARGGAVHSLSALAQRYAHSPGVLPQRKAGGGIVRPQYDYDPAAIDARAAALMDEIDAAA